MPGVVVALDPGARRIGVAVSDPEGKIALPRGIVDAGPDSLKEIAQIVDEAEATEVVVGLPLGLKGNEGEMARRARQFADDLRLILSVPVVLVDERLTTVGAVRSLREAGVKAKKQRGRTDQVAAALLLQGYLDSRQI